MIKHDFSTICEQIKNYDSTFEAIVENIISPLEANIDFGSSRIFREDGIVTLDLKSKNENMPIIVVFWFSPLRVSLFFEEYEIYDVYLSENEVDKACLQMLKSILSNTIEKEVYLSDTGEPKKMIYRYCYLMNGLKDASQTVMNRFYWFRRLTKKVQKFRPWI